MALRLVRPPREETPERWEKALSRAVEQGLEVFMVSDTGERLVTSSTRLDVVHRTDGFACTCEAALLGSDPVCQHRAVVRYIFGWLPDPTPPAPAVGGQAPRRHRRVAPPVEAIAA